MEDRIFFAALAGLLHDVGKEVTYVPGSISV